MGGSSSKVKTGSAHRERRLGGQTRQDRGGGEWGRLVEDGIKYIGLGRSA